MAVTIRIPTTLRPLTAGAGEVEVDEDGVAGDLGAPERPKSLRCWNLGF